MDNENSTGDEAKQARRQKIVANATRELGSKYDADTLHGYLRTCFEAEDAYLNSPLTAEAKLLECQKVPIEIREYAGINVEGLLEPIKRYFEDMKSQIPQERPVHKSLLQRILRL